MRSQSAARRFEARDSQASWTTSASSSWLSSPIRLPRTSTDRCPSKCGVVKNGVDSSRTSAVLSSSVATQNTITSVYRSPVAGSTASGRGLRKKTNDLPPTWYTGFSAEPGYTVTCGMPRASSCTSSTRALRRRPPDTAEAYGGAPAARTHRHPATMVR